MGDSVKLLFQHFDQMFKLGTVTSGPKKLRFFGINTFQMEYLTICTNADDKLDSLNEYCLTRISRKQNDAPVNDLQKSVFASTNSSFGWIWGASSPFCWFYASYLQQISPNIKVRHLTEQQTTLRKFKKLGKLLTTLDPRTNLNMK